jgi:membrane-bound acyltransferase YfiQ involved in biofilm formation
MAVRAEFPAHELTQILHNTGVRTGAYTGVALAIAFTVWLYVANRVPPLESVALQRNVIAATVFGVIAALPVLRFLRSPGNLLVSSLIAWGIFTVTYRILCVHFSDLAGRYSAPQVFALGAVVYMILATLCWIGTCIWRARESHISHPNHHL